MSIIIDNSKDILSAIARITGGYATITDNNGVRIKTYNSGGEEMTDMEGKVYELAKLAADTGEVQVGFSQIMEGAETWAVPLKNYVLAASNVEKYLREEHLMKALKEALPFIARVVGGEAVLFNAEGKRLACVDPYGETTTSVGKTSGFAKKAMITQKPVIGQSMSVNGAVAVRIPITDNYGIGFNDELRVEKEQKLVAEYKKYQYARYNFSDIIGESDAIQKVKSIASFIAGGISSVLIFGETGTGKELFAQAIHNSSERRSKPFVAINCSALPASIIESYLFGYEAGAFTGAKKEGSTGSFEQANGGTIFLDEISEMDFNLQSKLLRVLQEREVTRIGGTKTVKVDVRVIASTNKNLKELIEKGLFREDLYYRLNVVEVKIPLLRERKEDIPLLCKQFIKKYNVLLGKYVLNISNEAKSRLLMHDWPGNVRELQNCIEYAINMVSVNDETIQLKQLPPYFLDNHQDLEKESEIATLDDYVSKAEEKAIVRTLKIADGSKKEAARLLGISTPTLWRKMQKYRISE